MSGRLVAPMIAMVVGVTSGIYVFKPLLESYSESTGGTFKPEDDHHSAAVPPLPMTSLLPNKTKEGEALPSKPEEA